MGTAALTLQSGLSQDTIRASLTGFSFELQGATTRRIKAEHRGGDNQLLVVTGIGFRIALCLQRSLCDKCPFTVPPPASSTVHECE